MQDTEVLIVGAGPTGLVLALWLVRLGIRIRIIDSTLEPGTTSRAVAVQARTLEFYRQVGIADAVVERGRRVTGGTVWVGATPSARVPIGDMGKGLSPFPYVTIYPQDEHERTLVTRLGEAGVVVERGTELTEVRETDNGIEARLRARDGVHSTCQAAYVAGCDGAHSRVRETLAIAFSGSTYDRLFYVADISAGGAMLDGELHMTLDDADFVILFPMRDEGKARLIGTVPQRHAAEGRALSWDDVSARIAETTRLDIHAVNWFSTYHVHHRVAESFRRGRMFLLGDAGHIHSPVGGQGMNTGIGDAVNLAWKLAAVVRSAAVPALLDTYEAERIAFAKKLVATTDRVFTFVTRSGWLARRLRVDVVPRLLPPLFNSAALRRRMFGTVSQTRVSYRHSALSVGGNARARGGDRLPWVEPAAHEPDNFTPLAAIAWQIHVYGELSANLRSLAERRGIALHAFPFTEATERAGLQRNAAYLVRPDGYVGLVDASQDPSAVERYLERWGVAALAPSAPRSVGVSSR